MTGGAGGAGVSNAGTITTLTNSGAITGGAGAEDGGAGGVGARHPQILRRGRMKHGPRYCQV